MNSVNAEAEDGNDQTMTQLQWIDLFQQTLWMMTLLTAPVLVISMMVGIGISLFQVVTSIQDQTLTFVPKMMVMLLVLLFLAPWMVNTMVTHTQHVFEQLIKFS